MSRRGHIPIRTCLGCGARDAKTEMLRIVLAGEGGLALDAHQLQGGRGGYLHRRSACWSDFSRRKGLVRALKATVDRAARAAFVAGLDEPARKW